MGLIEAGLPALPDSPLRAALGTDTGRRREQNEDAVGAYLPSAGMSDPPVDAALLVADGVGGHEGGAWASTFVVDATRDTIEAQTGRIDNLGRWLDRLLHSVHEELLREAQSRGTPASMGSTVTLAVIQGRALTLAHVGDSRAYRLRNGRMEQLTDDDSWVAEQVRAGVLKSDDPEAESRKNVLTQCLGIGASLKVQIVDDHISAGDRYLLCSDGLHGVVEDGELQRMLAAGDSPEVTSATLIDLANERGGPDNISAVVLDIGTPPSYQRPSAPVGRAVDAPTRAFDTDGSAERAEPDAGAGVAVATTGSGRRRGNWVSGAGALLLVMAAGAWLAGQAGPAAARNAGASAPAASAPAGAAEATPAEPTTASGSRTGGAAADPALPETSTTSPAGAADPSNPASTLPDTLTRSGSDSLPMPAADSVAGGPVDTLQRVPGDTTGAPPDTTMIPNAGVLPRDSMTAPDTVPPDTTSTPHSHHHRPLPAQERSDV